jgi:hypothetical protein
MSMYLPNPDLRPTGSEAAEFVDIPPMAATPSKALAETNRHLTASGGAAVRLDTQTRLNITRWVEEYIAGLVENHNGGPEDVRSIIHQLHDQRSIVTHDGSL